MICWKIRIFAYWTTPMCSMCINHSKLWFAEKFVSLLIEQHLVLLTMVMLCCCDLLKNSYLCLLNNTDLRFTLKVSFVVICWKIRIFAYWTTPDRRRFARWNKLWFAEKFVSLLIEQHPNSSDSRISSCCDLLKNSYLCLLNNTQAGNG